MVKTRRNMMMILTEGSMWAEIEYRHTQLRHAARRSRRSRKPVRSPNPSEAWAVAQPSPRIPAQRSAGPDERPAASPESRSAA